jgi:serine/tyrosine/threonine adenylyltransferase
MTLSLKFDNRFVRELSGDPENSSRRRQVLGACWSHAEPTAVAAPRVVAYSREMLAVVGLNVSDASTPEFAAVFGGNAIVEGMQPFAACYGGHQFGNWAGQLGDGRAISLGETINAAGERWELQLKGAGPTPYSRTADGRAVLRSSIREFLCSEAMYHLRVPTTRALSLVSTGDMVVRDMFYNGDARPEPGAIVCRVAPSFIRFGNFEILSAREENGLLMLLVDFTIARDFPHLAGTVSERRIAWFAEVCERTASMVVHWQRVGFVHGVMNTDNMSILGLTIDFGPYGWLDNYDQNWTPNTTDAQGRRYRFGQQPAVAQWNLVQLANALYPIFDAAEPLQAGLDRYVAVYQREFEAMTIAKFGFLRSDDEVQAIMSEGYRLLEEAEMDFTRFFRALGDIGDALDPSEDVTSALGDVFYSDEKRDAHRDSISTWLRRWHDTVCAHDHDSSARRTRMHAVNPRFVFRNYLAQQAIELAESGDESMVSTLLNVLRRPYDEQPEFEVFAARRPESARHKAGSSMLSCSS